MKLASSLDGGTALLNGQSQWITGEAARTDGHAWRARSNVVLTGIGTVLQDNPRLDVRLIQTDKQPDLVIVDSHLQTPPDAHLFLIPRAVYIYSAEQNSLKKLVLEAMGATVIHLPLPNGKVDLAAMLQDLAERGVKEVHVEAGHKLNGSLIRENLVDEFLIYLAPKLLGEAQGMASFGPLDSLSEALELEFLEVRMIEADVFLRARVTGKNHQAQLSSPV